MGDLSKKTVIEAGAGTGKTTRIIDHMIETLVTDGVEPTRLLALTFTVKAANEMRDRLAGRLEQGLEEEEPDSDRRRRFEEVLSKVDRMEIGTIHSFAAHILRQFPVEAGVSPGFQVDEEGVLEALFRERWPAWVRERDIPFIDRVDPESLRDFVRALCDEDAPQKMTAAPELEEARREAVQFLETLEEKYGGFEQVHNDRCLRASRFMCEIFAGRGDSRRLPILDEATVHPTEKKRSKFPGWTGREWERFGETRRFARAMLDTDDRLMERVIRWADPFVRSFREEYARRGSVSMHDLLARTAALLRVHVEVRRHFKDRFLRILVDEFQDTDPLQGEILLYLAERSESFARHWREVDPKPGKLLIVGDPKQSIYLFRGADLDAYRGILEKLTGGDPSRRERLGVNYRSRPELVNFVNAVCEGRMTVPTYEPIEPHDPSDTGGRVEAMLFPDMKAEEARAAEGNAIADWILKEKLEWKETAILLRSLTGASWYTEALRNKGIAFAIEGEKTFWKVPEVEGFLNLLSAVADPTGEPAVVGLLRSPLGGVKDRDLLTLRNADAFCPLDADRVPAELPQVRELYEALTDLHRTARRIPTPELMRRILERFPLREVWADTWRGEQAVVNIEKLAAEVAAAGGRTLGAAVAEARRRALALEEEGESPLADERLDAVRILTIHKSKGLEFPTVVLADLHRQRSGRGRRRDDPILREWVTGRMGLRVGSVQNSDRWVLQQRREEREREEEMRLLYVALTRARDRLLITGGKASENSYLGMLEGVEGLEVIPVPEPQKKPKPSKASPEPDPEEERVRWEERAARAAEAAAGETIRRPSTHAEDLVRDLRDEEEEALGEKARQLGVRCHDLLATIDLSAPPEIDGEAGEVLAPFFETEAFREIVEADEVHREIPFLLKEEGEVWSGQIDVLYRLGKRWIVADYKTDRKESPELYREQARRYVAAVRRTLKLKADPEFRLIYLRSGRVAGL